MSSQPRPRLRAAALLATATAVVVSSLALSSSPAVAADGISEGRALVRIDSPEARVTKVGKSSYRIVLPASSPGQWLGARPDAQGRQRPRVGNLNAGKLAKAWGKFHYNKWVWATLAWTSSDSDVTQGVPVQLGRPKVTPDGVRFDFTSSIAVPTTLKNMSLNLDQAPKSRRATRSTPSPGPWNVYENVWASATGGTGTTVTANIYSSASGPCWTAALTTVHFSSSVGTLTCDSVTFKDSNTTLPAGAQADFAKNTALLTVILSMPDCAPYSTTHSIGLWF